MPRCLLGIGANLGDPARQITDAVRLLADHPQIRLQAKSRDWPTQPVGGPAGQPTFLNVAVLIETDLSPELLLAQIQAVERAIGRTRSAPWEARPIDLDILLYDDWVVQRPELKIPHPWMVARRFVLGPAAEIAPEQPHPVLGWSLARLWQHANAAPPRFALVGCAGLQLLQATAESAAARLIVDVDSAVRSAGLPSAVLDFGQQLELLDERVERLHQSNWNQLVPAQPLLCAFWIDESLVAAQTVLGARDQRRFEPEYARRVRTLEPPKLVILATGLMRARAAPAAAAHLEQLLIDLRQRVVDCGVSPLIEVESTARDDFVREVSGAIIAMSSAASPSRLDASS